ncbi:MAG: lysylphosphatidylglycerol synthase transmembrane domain-containing protein [Ignavibacteriaceae bacterium]
MLEKVKKNIFILLTCSVLFYIALTIYGNFDNVLQSFEQFNFYLLPILFILSFLTFLTRFYKWHYYIRLLKIKISVRESFIIFMSSLIMLATPGALGELFKSYLVKKITGEQISKTAPIIFSERITDFISVIMIALAGAILYNYGIFIMTLLIIIFLFLIIFISNKKVSIKFIGLLSGIKFLHKYLSKINVAYESFHSMLKGKSLFFMLFISLISWSFECLSFYIILKSSGLAISVLWAGFVYAFGTIIGSLTMLPGGVGVTDGSFVFLIVQKGFSKDAAIASTFIIRAVTLWFAVAVGAVFIFFYKNWFSDLYTGDNILSLDNDE